MTGWMSYLTKRRQRVQIRKHTTLTGRRTRMNNQPSNIFEDAEPTINANPTMTDVNDTISLKGFKPTTPRMTHRTSI